MNLFLPIETIETICLIRILSPFLSRTIFCHWKESSFWARDGRFCAYHRGGPGFDSQHHTHTKIEQTKKSPSKYVLFFSNWATWSVGYSVNYLIRYKKITVHTDHIYTEEQIFTHEESFSMFTQLQDILQAECLTIRRKQSQHQVFLFLPKYFLICSVT